MLSYSRKIDGCKGKWDRVDVMEGIAMKDKANTEFMEVLGKREMHCFFKKGIATG